MLSVARLILVKVELIVVPVYSTPHVIWYTAPLLSAHCVEELVEELSELHIWATEAVQLGAIPA